MEIFGFRPNLKSEVIALFTWLIIGIRFNMQEYRFLPENRWFTKTATKKDILALEGLTGWRENFFIV